MYRYNNKLLVNLDIMPVHTQVMNTCVLNVSIVTNGKILVIY